MTQPVLDNSDSTIDIKRKITTAVNMILKNDSALLTNAVNERSVTHKLAEYLQPLFPDWHVDCEYDRDGSTIKELDNIRECDGRTSDRILPDVIIHRRGSAKNLVVVEVKTKRGNYNCDYRKLKLFTADDGHFKYRLGVFIKFHSSEPPELKWYIHGNEELS